MYWNFEALFDFILSLPIYAIYKRHLFKKRLKDDKELESGENIMCMMEPKTRIAALHIRKATQADSGKYACVAFSESGGHAQTTCDIHVLRK